MPTEIRNQRQLITYLNILLWVFLLRNLTTTIHTVTTMIQNTTRTTTVIIRYETKDVEDLGPVVEDSSSETCIVVGLLDGSVGGMF